MEKVKVFVTFDNPNGTWNIHTMDKNCIFYGNIDEVERWLIERIDTHFEVRN